jgi:formate hydrogenlyase subunit 3/multisubunit Na+/H+ antiporter MnhD subunit
VSTPVIWILLPLALSILLLGLQRFQRLSLVMGGGVLLALAWSAGKLPIDQTFKIGPVSLRIADTLEVSGRTFVLGEAARPFLVLLFVLAAFWYFGALAAHVNSLFAPVGLAMLGFFVAALSVQPFLYSALLIEMAVLVSIPMLSPPHEPVRSGLTRYLIFLTLAMPFILFSGWMLTGVEAGNADINLPLRAGLLLGLGFALLLALFPFHSWIPLLAEQNHPYVTGYVFLLLQTVVLLFAVSLLDRFNWLRSTTVLYDVLRLAGVLMVVTGGGIAAFQRHLGRIMGCAILFESGFSLLAISISGQAGMEIFSMLFLPRAVAIGVWALSLSALRGVGGGLGFQDVVGIGRRYPLPSAGIILANLTLVGLPLLASFPVKLALLENLAVRFPIVAIWTMLGMVALLVAGLRSLAVLSNGDQWSHARGVHWSTEALLGVGMAILILAGLLPQVFLEPLLALLKSFAHLL